MTECQVSRLQDEVAELQERIERLRIELSWAVGYMHAELSCDGAKRGQNAAIDGQFDWLDRAKAALGDSQ